MDKDKYIEEYKSKIEALELSKKLYITYPSCAFEGKENIKFEILNEIANYFKIPLMSIKLVGSAQSGFSPIKKTEFKPGESDLDVSIISERLFIEYLGIVNSVTKGYQDLTLFKRNGEKQFMKYISLGIFRPDLMPGCKYKSDWFKFFNKLSEKHTDLFSDINAGIFLSEELFVLRQEKTIREWRNI